MSIVRFKPTHVAPTAQAVLRTLLVGDPQITISAAIGRIRPKVPKVLPIEKEMKQARTNKRPGSRKNARSVLISPAKYSLIPSQGDDLGCHPRQEQHRSSHQR
jgi:hypothetical protein